MPFETQAFVISEKNASFVLETIQLDDPLDNEVLVESECICLAVHTIA